jgi:hypothetical protein
VLLAVAWLTAGSLRGADVISDFNADNEGVTNFFDIVLLAELAS